MGREQHGFLAGRARAAPARDDILDVALRGGSPIAGLAHALYVGLEAQLAQLVHDVSTHGLFGGGANRVGLAPIASTCFMARTAENAKSGPSAGKTGGGVCELSASPPTTATNPIDANRANGRARGRFRGRPSHPGGLPSL